MSSTVSSTAANAPAASRVLVWDLPVRVFHWLMVASFALAWLTAESEHWRLVHVTLGYTMAGLVAFRIVWGLVGSRPARFASFVRGPAAVKAYLQSLRAGRPEHHTGHNPAGALAIIGLLGLAALTTALGWATYNELGGEWLAEGHEATATAMLLLVGVHLLGVVSGSLAHRENLVRAMVTGRKRGLPAEAAGRAANPLGALLLVAVLGFWAWQWQTAPAASKPTLAGLISSLREHDHHHDDD
jgi:cytochrome b